MGWASMLVHEEKIQISGRGWYWPVSGSGWEWVGFVWWVMVLVGQGRGLTRCKCRRVHGDVLGVPCLLRKVTGEGALPKMSRVVEPMVVVEVVGNIGHAQKDEEQPGSGPEQPRTLIVSAPVPCPADQVVDEGGSSLASVDRVG